MEIMKKDEAKKIMRDTFKGILKVPLKREIDNFNYNTLFNKEDLLNCYIEVIEEIRNEDL